VKGLEGVLEIIHRRRGRCKIEHGIDGPRDIDGIADVGLDELEARLLAEVIEVANAPSDQIIDADNSPPSRKEMVDEVTPDEPGSTKDDRSLLSGHRRITILLAHRRRAIDA